MSPIIWLLLFVLLLAPRTTLPRVGRALLLLVCVFTLLVRV